MPLLAKQGKQNNRKELFLQGFFALAMAPGEALR
jgi:hypothetical protein